MSENSSDDENFDSEQLVRDFENEARLVINNLLPVKSKRLYLKVYEDFMEWKNKNSSSFNENVFLVYFEELAKKFKPPTLWSIWSKLKLTLNVKEGINLDKYHMLKTSLKNKSKGYKPKKSKVLSLSLIKKFLELADDTFYLAMKVILLFGFFGALRCQEIINVQTTDVEDLENQFVITINESKTYLSRNFIIANEYYEIVKKYILLRPEGMSEQRFFVTYQKGKCTKQFIGKNKISEIPSIVATFLQLPEPEKYTGHCYRRSSATALSNAGGDLITIKNHGGWKSDNVAQGYIDFSTHNRRQIFNMISNSGNTPNNHFMNHPPITVRSTSEKVSTSDNNFDETDSLNNTEKENVPLDNHLSSTSKNESNNSVYVDNHLPSTSKNGNNNSVYVDNHLPSTSKNGNNNSVYVDKHLPSTSKNGSNNSIYLESDYVHHSNSSDPPLKKKRIEASDIKNQNQTDPPNVLLQNCEVHTINVNNNYYYSSKKQ